MDGWIGWIGWIDGLDGWNYTLKYGGKTVDKIADGLSV
jgi:hypothetical protein